MLNTVQIIQARNRAIVPRSLERMACRAEGLERAGLFRRSLGGLNAVDWFCNDGSASSGLSDVANWIN